MCFRTLKSIFFSIFLLMVIQVKAHEEPVDFSHTDYLNFKLMFAPLLNVFPPDRFVFMGLGRSPGPGIALFQELAKFHPEIFAFNVPFSTSKGGFPKEAALAADHLVVSNFDKYVDLKKIGNRSIVVIDAIVSGWSLVSGVAALSRYLHNKKQERTIELVGIGGLNEYSTVPEDVQERLRIHTMHFPNDDFAGRFLNEQFKRMAQFSRHSVFNVDAPEVLSNNDAYENLKTAIARYMKNDVDREKGNSDLLQISESAPLSIGEQHSLLMKISYEIPEKEQFGFTEIREKGWRKLNSFRVDDWQTIKITESVRLRSQIVMPNGGYAIFDIFMERKQNELVLSVESLRQVIKDSRGYWGFDFAPKATSYSDDSNGNIIIQLESGSLEVKKDGRVFWTDEKGNIHLTSTTTKITESKNIESIHKGNLLIKTSSSPPYLGKSGCLMFYKQNMGNR